MAKHDWIELEKEFITGKDRSLKKFAERKGFNHKSSNFRKHTQGWLKKKAEFRRQKGTKVIEKIQEEQISEEVALNRRHIDAYSKHLELIEKAMASEEGFYAMSGAKKGYLPNGEVFYVGGDKMYKVLKSTSAVLQRVQEGQRLALGLDKEKSDVNVEQKLADVFDKMGDAFKDD